MSQHIAVVVPLENGGWRAYLPDFPGCAREGPDRDTALAEVVRTAKEQVVRLQNIPCARSPLEIRDDHNWAAPRKINWSGAAMRLVDL